MKMYFVSQREMPNQLPEPDTAVRGSFWSSLQATNQLAETLNFRENSDEEESNPEYRFKVYECDIRTTGRVE